MLTGLSGAGRVGFDPVARRRVRRTGARLRPLLLPAAAVVAALVVVGGGPAPPATQDAPVDPLVPDGLVLVAVQPSDEAVLDVAVPGSRVDVYAADADVLEPLGDTGATARLVVADGLVVAPPQQVALPAASDVLGGAGGGGPGAITVAVTDAEAEALASRPGSALLVAVRGTGPGA